MSDKMKNFIVRAITGVLFVAAIVTCFLRPEAMMIALRYGTLPIVRETGGLRDTVQSYNEYEDTGNGFSFANYNAHEMLGAIRYALQTLQSPKRKHGLIQRAMESDNSFAKSAKIYLDMYNSVL